jgi:hypothetical protein
MLDISLAFCIFLASKYPEAKKKNGTAQAHTMS